MTGSLPAEQALALTVGGIVDELVRVGVHHVSVAPGSRSAPLALAVARHPRARLWMHLDERSAAFFALGLAKASRQPVALVCTSGSAAANFMPAVVEAFYARVPLVVLTADRPHELRDVGAAQTIDQVRIYGSHVKWFFDLEEPDGRPALVRHARAVVARAAAEARSTPMGPVHVNCPFREPLVPAFDAVADARDLYEADRPLVVASSGVATLPASDAAALAHDLASRSRGLVVAGPLEDPDLAPPLVELAAALGYPILADPLSGLRSGAHDRSLVLDAYDAFLRDPAFAEAHAPDVVLRVGAVPTSKPAFQFLQRYPKARHVLVDDGGWRDPLDLTTDLFRADPTTAVRQLRALLPSNNRSRRGWSWAEAWTIADRVARRAIDSSVGASDELFEGRVFLELADLLPADAGLFAGSSMPVRDLDTFFPGSDRRVRFLSNRGTNGIDGVVSSALGASAAGLDPLVLVIGDVSFYHDSNGLLAARRHGLKGTIVVLNNDGGGIFSFLPQADHPEHFETLFGTPHGLQFGPLAEMYGLQHTCVQSWDDFRAAVASSLASDGLQIVEVPAVSRERNVALHRAIWPKVTAALRQAGVARPS